MMADYKAGETGVAKLHISFDKGVSDGAVTIERTASGRAKRLANERFETLKERFISKYERTPSVSFAQIRRLLHTDDATTIKLEQATGYTLRRPGTVRLPVDEKSAPSSSNYLMRG